MQDNFHEAIEQIKKIVQIPSIKEDEINDAPFGEPIKVCLNEVLNIAIKMGFEVNNYDNYCGEIIYGEGKDKEGLAILGHLDVVPIGKLEEWIYPPFSATEKDGKIFGRGIIDDKGPILLCLYALYQLKKEGFMPNRKIKLILGCDEESGWGCIRHYNKVAIMPDEGFSPDGDFPVIYAEKGIFHIKYRFKKPKDLIYFSGGERVNVVCDYVKIKYINNNIEYEKEFLGKTAHGSTPELGDNAILKALEFLQQYDEIYLDILNNLFYDKLKLKEIKDETGNLTLSPNVIFCDKEYIYINVDIRYPAHIKIKELEKKLSIIGDFMVLNKQEPLIVDKNSRIIKELLKIYNEETNSKEEPIAIGGGTYARSLKKGVAFGPSYYKTPSVCHIPNEYASIEDLYKMYKIYYKAIKTLSL